MKVANQSVVSIHYTLKNSAGEVLDSSEGQEPLVYLHGAGNIISGLEDALADKAVGDQLNVVIAATDGYGEYSDDLVQRVPLTAFQGVENVEVGARFQAQTESGPVSVVVTEVDEESVVVDSNHPLAGQELHFDVSVAEVRAASEEEIAHGHVHMPGHSH